MSIDFNKIAQEKIAEMEESGEIKKHFEEALQKLILNSVTSYFDDWKTRDQIKDKIKEQIAPCLDTLDFTSYNSFICEKVKQITEEYLKKDIKDKVTRTFEEMFILKRETMLLSEIFEEYRKYLLESLDDSEQYDLGNEFYANIDVDEYGFLECGVSKEELSDRTTYLGIRRKALYICDIGFCVSKSHDDPKKGKIISVYFGGDSVKDVLKITSYNKFQTLMLNLYYNETPIEIDVDDASDIDTSLGLDF